MKVNNVDNINFGILKCVKSREYGQYMYGEYKGLRIEVYDAYKYNQLLIHIADKFKNLVKSKLIYWQDGVKKVTRCEGKINKFV